MLESQFQILRTRSSKFISIGITADGSARHSIPVPWKHTANAFNMRTPDVYLSPADLDDAEISALLERFIVFGCYVFDAVKDYSFIRRFPRLEDVYIFKGNQITDISFMNSLNGWYQFYIEDAVIPTLDPLLPAGGRRLSSHCVGLCNCRIGDPSALEQEQIRLSELVILQPQGSGDKKRWKNVNAATYSYYEFV